MGVRKGVASVALAAALAGCGGGGGDAGEGPPAPVPAPVPASAPNVLDVAVDGGTAGTLGVNQPFVSVRICAPGSTTHCQTIDHVLVDTGSAGLRVMASLLDPSIALPAQVDASGNPLAECAAFVDGVTWGAVRVADVGLAGLTAAAVPIHVVSDPAFPSVPATCASRGAVVGTIDGFGANGLLGVAAFVPDCGRACAQAPVAGAYYACPGGSCRAVAVDVASQVANPAARLATDNNGLALQFPAVPAEGAPKVAGSMTFGIGTRANNVPGGVVAYDLDATGNLVTDFDGTRRTSYVDSGSNALFFRASTLPVCPPGSGAMGYYCPETTGSFTATIRGASNGRSVVVPFDVANAAAAFSARPGWTAFPNVAAAVASPAFGWGMPFFYGRTTWVGFERRASPLGQGPFVAF